MRSESTSGLSILFLSVLTFVFCGRDSSWEARDRSEREAAERIARYMGEHFEQVTAAQRALIRGDLDEVRQVSRWLAEHQPVKGLPEGWEPYVEEMKVAARLAGEARTLRASAAATAAMARTCGKCHRGLGEKPRVPELGAKGLPPSDRIDTVPRMLRHQWAAEQMWVGLINPSEESWEAGSEVLADAPLAPEEMTGDGRLTEGVRELAHTVREVGAEALEVEDWDRRALLYGEISATCALCHERLVAHRTKGEKLW